MKRRRKIGGRMQLRMTGRCEDDDNEVHPAGLALTGDEYKDIGVTEGLLLNVLKSRKFASSLNSILPSFSILQNRRSRPTLNLI
jgi:hypothetical protein